MQQMDWTCWKLLRFSLARFWGPSCQQRRGGRDGSRHCKLQVGAEKWQINL